MFRNDETLCFVAVMFLLFACVCLMIGDVLQVCMSSVLPSQFAKFS